MTRWVREQILLLTLKHFQIFPEYLALAFADICGEGSCGLKLRAMPQKYQIEVSVCGVMKSTTMLEALTHGSA